MEYQSAKTELLEKLSSIGENNEDLVCRLNQSKISDEKIKRLFIEKRIFIIKGIVTVIGLLVYAPFLVVGASTNRAGIGFLLYAVFAVLYWILG